MDKVIEQPAVAEAKPGTIPGKTARAKDPAAVHPFWVIVTKEMSDHMRSWKFILLSALIVMTCMGSLYTAITNMAKAVDPGAPDDAFFFLKLYTLTDGTLPAFTVFISFLGPLLGISLGFDAINSEHNQGTLSRLLAQPIHRDYVINAKFVAALAVISVMLFALCFLVMGMGLFQIGVPPTAEEFWRIVFFIGISICYVAFWLNLSILFSIRFRQPATAALAGISVWIFFTVFYQLIVNLIAKATAPSFMATPDQVVSYESFISTLMRIIPSQLFSDATITLLMPSVRSLSPLTMEQVYGSVAGPLPLAQSVLLVWPQITGLLAASLVCFGLSYRMFMRREVRSR